MARCLTVVAATLAIIATAQAKAYTIASEQAGRRLDGYGSLSGGGATSRLLFQYPEPQLSEILDYLFKPSWGASLHSLKVEIGGDAQSSEGVEPSHSHFAGDLNYARGYEWRLMVEARKRNPDILLGALAWAWPGYIGAGTASPWTNVTLSAGYVVDFLRGARDVYNTTIDYVDADWNERGYSSDFVKELRRQLDAAGFGSTFLVCGDDLHTFHCAADVRADPELAAAVYALGSHNPTGDAAAQAMDVPLWGSELEVADPGGTDLATTWARLYNSWNVTGYVLWNAVSAYHPKLFAPDQGIFRAWWPWNGHYEPSGRLWVLAHHTQATAPGWRFVRQGAGSGALAGGGVYTAYVDPPTGGFTLVLYKPAGGAVEDAAFTLTGPAAALTALHAVRSTVAKSANPDTAGYFLRQPDVAVANGAFALNLRPGDMWTLSTVATMAKGAPPAPPPPAAPFPVGAYSDDFDGCAPSQEAAYWTDQSGVFECVASPDPGRGVVMRQMVPVRPLTWWPDPNGGTADQRPFSVFQATIDLADSDASLDVWLPAAGDAALVGARANPNCVPACGRVVLDGENAMPGLWWHVPAGGGNWSVWNAIANVTTNFGMLATGAAPAPVAPGAWHTLRLVVAAGAAAGFVDGEPAFAGLRVQGRVPATGFLGLGVGAWGTHALFDNFKLAAQTVSA